METLRFQKCTSPHQLTTLLMTPLHCQATQREDTYIKLLWQSISLTLSQSHMHTLKGSVSLREGVWLLRLLAVCDKMHLESMLITFAIKSMKASHGPLLPLFSQQQDYNNPLVLSFPNGYTVVDICIVVWNQSVSSISPLILHTVFLIPNTKLTLVLSVIVLLGQSHIQSCAVRLQSRCYLEGWRVWYK